LSRRSWLALLLGLAISPLAWGQALQVEDDSGAQVRLPRPATRILALSPHGAELAFAAGAGDLLVGVTAWADYPPAAGRLPQVGDATHLNRESLLLLQPDLVLAWPDGNRVQDLAWIERQGIPLYRSAPRRLADIPRTLRDLGRLTARDSGEAAARAFEERLAGLRTRYADNPPRQVFYQLWSRPLMTLGQAPLFDETLALCGARNLFGTLPVAAPSLSREAVILANPDAILADQEQADPFAAWRRWTQVTAVADGRLLAIPADLLQRPTPRLLDGVEQLCEGLRTIPPG